MSKNPPYQLDLFEFKDIATGVLTPSQNRKRNAYGLSLFNTGIEFFHKKEYDLAIEFYKRAYSMLQKVPARLMAAIGNAYLYKSKRSKDKKDFYEAFRYFKMASSRARGWEKKDYEKQANDIYAVYQYLYKN